MNEPPIPCQPSTHHNLGFCTEMRDTYIFYRNQLAEYKRRRVHHSKEKKDLDKCIDLVLEVLGYDHVIENLEQSLSRAIKESNQRVIFYATLMHKMSMKKANTRQVRARKKEAKQSYV